MSEKNNLDSSVLENEVKEVNSTPEVPKKRLASIDFVKGFAIIMIMVAHVGVYWLDDEWRYTYAMTHISLDWVGPGLFVTLSALSVVFSVNNKRGKVPEAVIRANIFARGMIIIIIGLIYNLLGIGGKIFFPYSLWGWNILTFIGFSQIFTYYALKLTKKLRMVIGILIILVSEPLREFLYLEKDENVGTYILWALITSENPSIPLFPWLSVCFIACIFGEFLVEAVEVGTNEAFMRLFKIFMVSGFIFFIVGFVMGIQLVDSNDLVHSEYPFMEVLDILNTNRYYQFPGIPKFMIRSTSSNMFYSLGLSLMFMGVSFYYIDIKGADNDFIKMLKFYGKISLNLFLVHYIFLFIFHDQFTIVEFPIIGLMFIAFMGFFMYIWTIYGGGVGSPEWLMGKALGGGGSKKKKPRGPPKEKPLE